MIRVPVCARVRPCVPCVSRLPPVSFYQYRYGIGVYLPVRAPNLLPWESHGWASVKPARVRPRVFDSIMGSGCAKPAHVRPDDQNHTSAVLRHASRAAALASDGVSNRSALQRELELLVKLLQPATARPGDRALSGNVHDSFASMLSEGIKGHDEEAPDEKVVDWLRETLVAPVILGGGGKLTGVPLIATPFSTAFWVLPEAMARVLSGSMLDEPLTISDSCRADALACLDTWDYDTLALQEASGGHALLLIGEALFGFHQLHEPCHVERAVARRFLRALEMGYGNNPYHNAMHGADVALGVHRFLVKFGLTARLTKLQLLAALVGALVHDFNHPGTNNGHEARACTERARTHTDSVLERHHLHSTFTLLGTPGFDLLGGMAANDREVCRKLIIDIVLSTDLAKHFDVLSTLRALAAVHGAAAAVSFGATREREESAQHGAYEHPAEPSGLMSRPRRASMVWGGAVGVTKQDSKPRRNRRRSVEASELRPSEIRASPGSDVRLSAPTRDWTSPLHAEALVPVPLLLQVAVKFADLGHCFKPLQLHRQWTERVTAEFWALGDLERRLGVGLSPLCDRQTDMDVAQSQVGFFKFICLPFYSVVADLVDPNMLPWLRMQANLQTWKLDGGALQRKLRATGQAAVLTRSMTMDIRSSHSLKKWTEGLA